MNPSIQLPIAELKSAILGLSKVVQKSTPLPVLSRIRIRSIPSSSSSTSSTHHVTLLATDLDDFVMFQMSPSSSSSCSFDALVPFDGFSKIVKSSPTNGMLQLDLTSSVPQQQEIVASYFVGSARMEQRWRALPMEDWPACPVIDSSNSFLVDDTFKAALLAALDCCSEDESRQILQSAFLDAEEQNSQYLVGTDGKHLFAANSFALPIEKSVLFPHRRFICWNGFHADGHWNITYQPARPEENTPGYVQIDSNRWTLISKQCDGTYPNWRAPIPSYAEDDSSHTKVEFTEDAARWLCCAIPQFPPEDDSSIRIIVLGGLVFIEGGKKTARLKEEENSSNGRHHIEGATALGRDMSICVDRHLALKAFRFGFREMVIFDETSPVLFTQKGRKMVVAPMRSENPPTPPSATIAAIASTAPINAAPPHSSIVPTIVSSLPVENIDQENTAKEPVSTGRIISSAPITENSNPTMNHRIDNPRSRIASSATSESTSTSTSSAIGGAPLAASSSSCSIKGVLDQVDQLRDVLRSAIGSLNDVSKNLSAIQKERKASEKEIESIREKLRAIRSVSI